MHQTHMFFLLIALTASCFSKLSKENDTSQLDKIDESLVGLKLDRPGPFIPVRGSYSFPPEYDSLVFPNKFTDLRAEVTIPKSETLTEKAYPLVMIMHGNHSACAYFSDGIQYESPSIMTEQGCRKSVCSYLEDSYQRRGITDFKCPLNLRVEEIESNKGYRHITDFLASHGFVTVSINTNMNINVQFDSSSADSLFILPRARLLLKHLYYLQKMNRGEPINGDLSIDLSGKIDFSSIGFMGHSRGGEGVRYAYYLLQQKDESSYAKQLDQVQVDGILEIAPTDSLYLYNLSDSISTNWSVIIPSCDGDVSDYSGYRQFQRASSASSGTELSVFNVLGADHNSFNDNWIQQDGSCLSGQSALPREKVVKISTQINYAFFKGFIGKEKDESLKNIFDPQYRLPESLSSLMEYERESLGEGMKNKATITASEQQKVSTLETTDYDRNIHIVHWDSIESRQEDSITLTLDHPLSTKEDILSFSVKPLNLWRKCNFSENHSCPGQQNYLDFSIKVKLKNGEISSAVRLSDYKNLKTRFSYQVSCRVSDNPLCRNPGPIKDITCSDSFFEETHEGCFVKESISKERCASSGGYYSTSELPSQSQCLVYGENEFRHIPLQEIPIEIKDFGIDPSSPIEAIVFTFDQGSSGTFAINSIVHMRTSD